MSIVIAFNLNCICWTSLGWLPPRGPWNPILVPFDPRLPKQIKKILNDFQLKVHIHVCFFLEVFTDSVTVDLFFGTVFMIFHATSTFFLWRVCAHLFWFLVVWLDIKTNLEKISQSGSSSSKSKQIVNSATTKNQSKCAHSSEKKPC